MKERLESLLKEALTEVRLAGDINTAQQAKARYLGRKAVLASLIKELGGLSDGERKSAGELINRVKGAIEAEVDLRIKNLRELEKAGRLSKDRLDITLPGRLTHPGRRHPVSQVMEEIEDIFTGLGFKAAEGPEVELDFYNFEALNIPKDHPAREMQDTFYVSE
ncbi:MAG: phenylalanine--tRNA ligase subunit alpha, partial [Deltaproteobacteria bacterium]|nr:phenylalanine--tRNA ligase subunit alpha [Deltaproteobacteria bacterium]